MGAVRQGGERRGWGKMPLKLPLQGEDQGFYGPDLLSQCPTA